MAVDTDDLVAAVAGLRADGPHMVRLRVPQRFLNTQLKEIARWLVEWQMPHSIRLNRESPKICTVEVRFPDEKHARAFAYQFEAVC